MIFAPGDIIYRHLATKDGTTWRVVLPDGSARLICSDVKPTVLISKAIMEVDKVYMHVPDDQVPPRIWVALAKLKLTQGD